MELWGRLPASWSAMVLFALFGMAACPMRAAASEPLTVSFPGTPKGRSGQSIAAPMASQGETVWVTVVMPGANPAAPSLREGQRLVAARVVGHDPISRLAFLRAGQDAGGAPMEWLTDSRESGTGTLRALVDGESVECQAKGWINKVGGKVLPLALLKVDFHGSVPLAGTPLLDPRNRVAALFFQSDGSGRAGYAIPSEAVHRVRRDIMQTGAPVRGWLGFTFSPENPSARVVRVLTDSPAALAGVMPGDILQSVGGRQVTQYADVANAFFYLVPGEPTRLSFKRGGQTLEFTVTPTRPQAE